MTNKQKAKMLFQCGFFVAGQGCFDITIAEFALILDLLDKKEEKKLKDLYDEFAQYRLGEISS